MDGLSDRQIAALLLGTRRVAVVGASADPARPSHGVMRFLIAHGFEVTAVNPRLAGQGVLGRPVVGRLAEAGPLDMVDVFRRACLAGAVVDEAIGLGARSIWLQLGVIDPAALARAQAAGLVAVMDRCPAIEWARLGIAQPGMARPG